MTPVWPVVSARSATAAAPPSPHARHDRAGGSTVHTALNRTDGRSTMKLHLDAATTAIVTMECQRGVIGDLS
ncbi:MAG TPA: hypothetical protein PLP95_05005, partial [Microthrixaceae bacterium]|nr:hypothetical protein [Microthrixaceae bacterium]